MLVVAKDGSGDFSNISNALAWIQENQEKSERVIFIRSGIYEERVEIRTPYLTLIGENAETTKIICMRRCRWKISENWEHFVLIPCL